MHNTFSEIHFTEKVQNLDPQFIKISFNLIILQGTQFKYIVMSYWDFKTAAMA